MKRHQLLSPFATIFSSFYLYVFVFFSLFFRFLSFFSFPYYFALHLYSILFNSFVKIYLSFQFSYKIDLIFFTLITFFFSYSALLCSALLCFALLSFTLLSSTFAFNKKLKLWLVLFFLNYFPELQLLMLNPRHHCLIAI